MQIYLCYVLTALFYFHFNIFISSLLSVINITYNTIYSITCNITYKSQRHQWQCQRRQTNSKLSFLETISIKTIRERNNAIFWLNYLYLLRTLISRNDALIGWNKWKWLIYYSIRHFLSILFPVSIQVYYWSISDLRHFHIYPIQKILSAKRHENHSFLLHVFKSATYVCYTS